MASDGIHGKKGMFTKSSSFFVEFVSRFGQRTQFEGLQNESDTMMMKKIVIQFLMYQKGKERKE